LETSNPMESNGVKISSIIKYSYIILAGFFVFINCYLGAINFISEESSKINYFEFIPFMIWGIGVAWGIPATIVMLLIIGIALRHSIHLYVSFGLGLIGWLIFLFAQDIIAKHIGS
jgi:hypothetical protein